MGTSFLLLLALMQAPIDGARAAASARPSAITAAAPAPASNGITVRITSPLGRSGMHGKIRIVAQIRSNDSAPITQVRFLIDQQPYKIDTIFDTAHFVLTRYAAREPGAAEREAAEALLDQLQSFTPYKHLGNV